MCTASWLRRDDRLCVFFNRDELRTREPALAPARLESEGVAFLAPRDGRAGGTWLAVTERGLVLALLNRSEGPRPTQPGSRGRLIPRLAAAGSPDELAARLLREPLRDLAPFRLVAHWLTPAFAATAVWDGERVFWEELDTELGLLCSSGLGDGAVTRARGEVWRRARARAERWDLTEHRALHRSHEPEPSAWSVCMHREDAETVGYGEVVLDAEVAVLRYADGPPCAEAPAIELRLALAGTAPG